MTHKLYDTRTDFHSWSCDSGWLPLVKDLYCSQEKRLSLLIKKRIRKTEEYALCYSTNVVNSRYYTSLQFGSPILEKQQTVRHQLQREGVILNNIFCTVLGRLLCCYLCKSIKGVSGIHIGGQKLSKGVVYCIGCRLKLNNCTVVTTHCTVFSIEYT